MAKIMLVEDDTNLSEIYQARLTAEGYDIVSAHDGEEALALAAKEKPDLIISDVMMPKISGFEMLDILRNTEGLKETKVIMLTALGQADDQTRAQGLGADRYLVKSQVTLEDIVKAAQELLAGDDGTSAPTAATEPTPAPVAAAPVVPTPTPVATAPEPQQPAPEIPVAAPPQAQPPVAAPAPAPTPVSQLPVPSVPVTPPAPAPEVPEPVLQPPITPVPTVTPAPAPTPLVAPPTPAPQPPVPPTPAPTMPVTPADTTAAADNQLVTDAVEDLEKAAQPAPTDTDMATQPTPADPPKENTSDTAPTDSEPKSDNTTTNNDNVGIAHKKVIQPIGESAPPKPNLETLLADEERKNPVVIGNTQGQSAATPPPHTPHQPGHIISPETTDASPNASGGVDPNSIAL